MKLDRKALGWIAISLLGLIIIGLIVLIIRALRGSKKVTYTFSEDLEKFLSIMHPSVEDRFRELVYKMEQKGYTVIPTSSYRTFAHQARLYAENNKNARPGRSRHNYGFALDINLRKNGVQIRKASPIAEWEATGIPQIARQLGFTWGGDFASYHDPVHFAINEPSTDELYQKAVAQFGSDPKAIRGNQVKL
ncbi:MAG: M15 family metallopeptidase [Saprospiraceae bacterium]|nr:M15 family metallopeptidase [Saprospiraceae bacterium]